MSAPAIVALVATWRGERLLERCVASCRGNVDATVVLDGAYSYADATLPAWSSSEELAGAVAAGAIVHPAPWPPGTTWRDELSKRNALLELGRAALDAAAVDGERWALVLDEDETLAHGELLRPFLRASLAASAVPVLYRVEPDGSVWAAPSRLFPLGETTRYAGRSYWLAGDVPEPFRDLSHWPAPDVDAAALETPHVRHHWHERSEQRAAAREASGRHLAELDGHTRSR